MEESPKTEKKAPVKVRLARKYAKAHLGEFFEDDTTPLASGEQAVEKACADAYLAGFDRAKLLYQDAVHRFCDEFVPREKSGKTISEVFALIGELP
jgi:hypothetical protein